MRAKVRDSTLFKALDVTEWLKDDGDLIVNTSLSLKSISAKLSVRAASTRFIGRKGSWR
jgi:hypothetical protein